MRLAFILSLSWIWIFVWCSVEYNVSYVYHALYAYFDRDNVALKGLAKWVFLWYWNLCADIRSVWWWIICCLVFFAESGFSRNRVWKNESTLSCWWSIRSLTNDFILLSFISLMIIWAKFVTSYIFGFLDLQNKRGGRVKLQPMVLPQSEFDHPEKGDALYGKLHFHFWDFR